MDKEQIKILIEKYLNGTATVSESAVVETWYNTYFEDESNLPDVQMILMATDRIADKLQVEELAETNVRPKLKTIKLWPAMHRIAGLVAVFATILFCIWFFNFWKPGSSSVLHTDRLVQTAIIPGRNGATLTLSNGKVINLSDAKNGIIISPTSLTYDDGSVISSDIKNPSSSYRDGTEVEVTASTAIGQTYLVVLPDGTKVWLNAASKITFPSVFKASAARVINLSGEAYFEVVKNKMQPFMVKTSKRNNIPGQEISVLGTHFNVSAYTDGAFIKTTLLEGSVQVKASGTAILKPRQQSVLTTDRILRVSDVDTEQAVAWKNGYFSFNDEKIQTVMQVVARWYNVEVSYEGNITKDGFNGKISRFKDINQVLKMLEGTKLVHFNIIGRRVIVKE